MLAQEITPDWATNGLHAAGYAFQLFGNVIMSTTGSFTSSVVTSGKVLFVFK